MIMMVKRMHTIGSIHKNVIRCFSNNMQHGTDDGYGKDKGKVSSRSVVLGEVDKLFPRLQEIERADYVRGLDFSYHVKPAIEALNKLGLSEQELHSLTEKNPNALVISQDKEKRTDILEFIDYLRNGLGIQEDKDIKEIIRVNSKLLNATLPKISTLVDLLRSQLSLSQVNNE